MGIYGRVFFVRAVTVVGALLTLFFLSICPFVPPW
jgi:hypothetical protein